MLKHIKETDSAHLSSYCFPVSTLYLLPPHLLPPIPVCCSLCSLIIQSSNMAWVEVNSKLVYNIVKIFSRSKDQTGIYGYNLFGFSSGGAHSEAIKSIKIGDNVLMCKCTHLNCRMLEVIN